VIKLKILAFLFLLILILPMGVKAEAVSLSEPNRDSNTLTLKVMTFNIHSAINWYGSFDLDGLVGFIRDFDPDIVGLQEVDCVWSSMSSFQDLPTELAQRLNMYCTYSASRERNNGYFGNLILSKYPITQVWTCPLPGSLEPRSFAFVQLRVNGVQLNFLTTHLGLSVADRLQQATKIIDFINQVSGPTIVAGDFNGGDDDPAVSDLKRNFLDLQRLSEFKDFGTFRSKDGKLSSKMDYILTTPEFSFTKLQVIDNYVSDHLPLIAEVTLNLR
jgi:endonuclease/exonuclease/phosphatase family metal-dependent hydrolase